MISVIVTTYNRPDALDLVLSSLENQSYPNFEVIIADDGSSIETTRLVREWQSKGRFPVIHVYQENQGFRAARIRNQAALKASADYLVFIDGDCVLPSFFLERHIALAKKNFFVAGNRILLNEAFTSKALKYQIFLWKLSVLRWILLWIQGSANRFLPLVYLPFKRVRLWKKHSWDGVKTCNLGIWKEDFFEVNGFDEAYRGWGYEDSDLVIRLLNLGVGRIDGRLGLGVFHLWHPIAERSQTGDNLARLKAIQQSNTSWAMEGLGLERKKIPASLVMIVHNEEKDLPHALESIQDFDDIVIVDSFSTDRTLEIASLYTKRIYQIPWPGFAQQKQNAVNLARYPWVLILDGDERATPELLREIRQILALSYDPTYGYRVPRKNFFLGRLIRHGSWAQDAPLRFFHKDHGTIPPREVHERVELLGPPPGLLRGSLLHYTHRDLTDCIEKTDRYTGLGALELKKQGKSPSLVSLVSRPIFLFIRLYILKRGFLDGVPGFLTASLAAFATFLKYAKLWELSLFNEGPPHRQSMTHKAPPSSAS